MEKTDAEENNTAAGAPTAVDAKPSPGQSPTTVDAKPSPGQSPITVDAKPSPGQSPTTVDVKSSPAQSPITVDVKSSPGHSSNVQQVQHPGGKATPESQDPQSPEVFTIDSDSDSDSDDDDSDCLYTNPAPHKELLDKHLIDADTIGDSVFSKHWLFTTLMKLIQEVDKEDEGKTDVSDGSDNCVDLDESLQDELCKLWDMSMNPAVVSFLLEFESIDLLTSVISKSKAPRAVEICVGILANMACIPAACRAISSNEKLRSLLLLLLSSPDAPTLVETTRLVYTCVASPIVGELWLSSIRETEPLFSSLVFMLQSSTSKDLLGHVADLIDKLMDTEDSLLVEWSNSELVEAILEAVKQIGNKEILETFLHILQLVSTCEAGVEALGQQAEPLFNLVREYLERLCAEDIVILQGEENNIGSALSVLAVAFTAVDDKARILGKDFQLMRSLLKLLEVVYPKLRSTTPELKPQRSRSDSCSSVGPGPRSRTISRTSVSVEGATSKAEAAESDKPQPGTTETDTTATDSDDCCITKTEPALQREPELDSDVVEMLYELLQNILTDVVLVLSEEDGEQHMESDDTETDQPSEQPAPANNKPTSQSQTLVYLNDQCPRQRLRIAVHTLDEVRTDTDLDCCGRLQQVALKHGLSRLEGIIRQYSAG